MQINYRLILSLAIFILFLLWELLRPQRQLIQNKLVRWYSNIGLGALNIIIIKLFASSSLVIVAQYCSIHDIGLINFFNLENFAPNTVIIIVSLLILDCAIYFQHLASHKINFLWKIHKVHHTDLELDVSTAIRFHPLEICLSLLFKIFLVLIFGFGVYTVIIFETMLYATAAFNHSNILLPHRLNEVLKKYIITPSIHIVHHSIKPKETNSNFGFSITVWDRLFNTYKAKAEQSTDTVSLGLSQHRKPMGLLTLLILPFK